MTDELILTRARLILEQDIVHGTLVVRDGCIHDIASGTSRVAGAIDCEGDDVIPGLVELHTDNLEKHLMPRNGVLWPVLPAVMTHDAQCVAAGITTVFDALAVGDLEGESVRLDTLFSAFDAINEGRTRGVLRAGHLFHLRCELAWPKLVPTLLRLIGHPSVGLLSVMDHTPGQRQYRDIEQYRKYYAKKTVGWNNDTFLAAVEERHQQQALHAADNKAAVLQLAAHHSLVLASHDDTEESHIDEAVRDGVSLTEFPTTATAARAARQAGLQIIMGAPNVVRGGSHSGNVAALDLARDGLLDILSSDYVPVSLLHGAYLLAQQGGYTLPRAIATVTANPARATGLLDRGRLAVGCRADLVRVTGTPDCLHIKTVWRAGERIY